MDRDLELRHGWLDPAAHPHTPHPEMYPKRVYLIPDLLRSLLTASRPHLPHGRIPAGLEQELPPENERIPLREAARIFDPPKTKKALEQLIQRDALDFAREKTPEGTTSRVVTTKAWVEAYAARARGNTRLRGEVEPVRIVSVLEERLAPISSPLERVVRELNEEVLRLRLRIAELEAELERRR
jgi:hypothetical protein